MKNIRIFYLKNCHFLVVKFSAYLNRHVFVMCSMKKLRSGLTQKADQFFTFVMMALEHHWAKCVMLEIIRQKQKTGLWNYQILILVNGQVNVQYPLVQPRFTCLNLQLSKKHMLLVLMI